MSSHSMLTCSQATHAPVSYYNRAALSQKRRSHSAFPPQSRISAYRPGVSNHDMDTDFEDDCSDAEEEDDFPGRRSEDSVSLRGARIAASLGLVLLTKTQTGKRSDTTLSSFDELRTPASTYGGFEKFNFQLDGQFLPTKSVEGPVGPHLFRMSQEPAKEADIYLSMSPPASPEEARAPFRSASRQQQRQQPQSQPQQPPAKQIERFDDAPRTSVPLRTWSPQQVAEWMHSLGFERSIVDTFFINDIAGTTLIDLQYDDLKELGITSFGQRHKLWAEIKALKDTKLPAPGEDMCFSPPATARERIFEEPPVSPPAQPDVPARQDPTLRRGRSARRPNDIISPADSVSIVAIEQVLPKPPKCTKCSDRAKCSKWRKYQRELARIAKDLPIDLETITEAKPGSPVESGFGPSIVVPSVVASSDVLGASKPAVRLEEEKLKVVKQRDPQENVRQFLQFQHLGAPAGPAAADPSTPPYEMFPPLSPPAAGAAPPHQQQQLRNLPRLAIPPTPPASDQAFSPSSRTAVPSRAGAATATPLTALDVATPRAAAHDIYRMASPASEMDVPVTAIPNGPVERDFSSSVPPDMRFGGAELAEPEPADFLRPRVRVQPLPSTFQLPSVFPPRPAPGSNQPRRPQRSASCARGNRLRHQSALATVPAHDDEDGDGSDAETEIDDQLTPTGEAAPAFPAVRGGLAASDASSSTCPGSRGSDVTAKDDGKHQGWMKKRKTKMLRHEWQEHHFRLDGTRLALHPDEAPASQPLENIDVDEYAVAIAGAGGSKINAAFKRLHIGAGKKGMEPGGFAFQLTPAAKEVGERKAVAGTGKTHHFAVRTQTERIDWMRELMLARARKQKDATHTRFE